jgi:hypothetical protein
VLPSVTGLMEQECHVLRGSTLRVIRLNLYICFLPQIMPDFWEPHAYLLCCLTDFNET